jgi:galactose mutarotase-like enzyme
MGGFLFTCGLENVCAPCTSNGRDYAMHGRIRTTPAENLSAEVILEEGIPTVVVSATMREAELFGRNLFLRRTLKTQLGCSSLHIHDELTNQAFKPEPFSLLYHCNFGYPLLDENCYIKINSNSIIAQNNHARDSIDRCLKMDPPSDDEREMVYMHDVIPDKGDSCSARIVNPLLKKAIHISWKKEQLKHCFEWKSPVSGDYVLAIEPSNSSFEGRAVLEEKGAMEVIQPGETRQFDLDFSVLEGSEAL